MNHKLSVCSIISAILLGCSGSPQKKQYANSPPSPPPLSDIFSKAAAVDISDRILFSTALSRPFYIEKMGGECERSERNESACRSAISQALQGFGFQIIDRKTSLADFNSIYCDVKTSNVNLYPYDTKYNRNTRKYSTICSFVDGVSGRKFASSQGFSIPERERDNFTDSDATLFDVATGLTKLVVDIALIPVKIAIDTGEDAYNTARGIQNLSSMYSYPSNINNNDNETLIMIKGVKHSISQAINMPWNSLQRISNTPIVVEAEGFDDGIVSNRNKDFQEAVQNAIAIASRKAGVRVRTRDNVSESYSNGSHDSSQYSVTNVTGDAYVKDYYVINDYGYGPNGYKVKIRATTQLN